MAKVENNINNFLIRYCPNKVFISKKVQIKTNNKYLSMYNQDKSKTDKEAYRVTLASMRAQTLASNSPASAGQYGFPAGTSIDMIRKYDDSYFRRPDLTLADIDNAIRDLKEQCENLDEQNAMNIVKDIQNAEKVRATLEELNKKPTFQGDNSTE